MMKKPVTRFAPSPTGRLHLGHAYSALLSHRFARERGGSFLLRIEDIDPGRARPEFVDGIIEDLHWLGIRWDGEVIFQSKRLNIYADALRKLRDQGLAYPCFCTRSAIAAEVAASASAPHGPEGIVYPGSCRRLGPAEREERTGREAHAWRIDMARAIEVAGPLFWSEADKGMEARPERFGDVVLARKDAPTSYHLAVTVDDAAQQVTDIVRGRDLVDSTDIHRLLQALLGLPSPTYHHHPLLVGADGRRLAKRNGAPTLAALRAAGADPQALAADLLRGQLPAGYSAASA